MTNLRADGPIGIFDSGVGGLTVANAIHKLLPMERLIYFGDSAHLPYGDKSAEAIRHFSLEICKHLVSLGCKAIVVACNSASTAALDVLTEYLRDKAILIEVVRPLVDEVHHKHPKKVGIIATKATVSSGVYQSYLKEIIPDGEVVAKATPLIVPMIEEGIVEGQIAEAILGNYLDDPDFEDLDMLLLACTHYPLVHDLIQSHMKHVDVIDSTQVTAMALKTALDRAGLVRISPSTEPNSFFVSDYTETFDKSARIFFGEDVHLVENNIW